MKRNRLILAVVFLLGSLNVSHSQNPNERVPNIIRNATPKEAELANLKKIIALQETLIERLKEENKRLKTEVNRLSAVR